MATADGRIFISYRRQETAWPARQVYEALCERYGVSQVFKDVDNIAPGEDFVARVSSMVASCQVLLAMLGPRWAAITDEDGNRRIDDPDDFVRLEVATALSRGVLVVPILVDGARMPKAADLPPDLAGITRRQAVEISPTGFNLDRLFKALDDALSESAGGTGPAAAPAGSDEAAEVAAVGPQPEPVLPEPVPPEPVAPEPVIPGPGRPEPVVPEPVTPGPEIPEPVVPEPVTPGPEIPEPVVPEPVTAAPLGTDPLTPEPARPEPAAPEPGVPQPEPPGPGPLVVPSQPEIVPPHPLEVPTGPGITPPAPGTPAPGTPAPGTPEPGPAPPEPGIPQPEPPRAAVAGSGSAPPPPPEPAPEPRRRRRAPVLIGLGALVLVAGAGVATAALLPRGGGPVAGDAPATPTPSVATSAPAFPVTFSVDGAGMHADAPIPCTTGRVLSITADGELTAKERTAGADGSAGRFSDKAPVAGAPLGALIGQVGGSGPFFVGDTRTLACLNDGEVTLAINDPDPAGYDGELEVTVIARDDLPADELVTDRFVLPATTPWLVTAHQCTEDQLFRVSATGVTSAEGAAVSAAGGADGVRPRNGKLVPGAAAKKYAHRALLGRIGDGSPFLLGSSATLTCPSDGPLEVQVNDGVLEDNTGELTVTLSRWSEA